MLFSSGSRFKTVVAFSQRNVQLRGIGFEKGCREFKGTAWPTCYGFWS